MQQQPAKDLDSQLDVTSDTARAADDHPFSDPTVPAAPAHHPPSLFYTQEPEDDLDLHLPFADAQGDQTDQAAPFVLPFQNSTPMRPLAQIPTPAVPIAMGAPSAPTTGKPRRRWAQRRTLLLFVVILLALIGATGLVFAQSIPSASSPPKKNTSGKQATRAIPSPQPTSIQSSTTPTTRQEQPPPTTNAGLPSLQLLGQLGWSQAGLTLADAAEALRTASTFTDREMSYDYRNIGTPTHHSGTLTGATFLLTAGGQARFAQNDKRAINNTLYDQIQVNKTIQQVTGPLPSLVQVRTSSVRGQPQLFAWVQVTFTLLQATTDPKTGQRTERMEQTTAGQPVLHQMTVVLLRVAPQTQGVNAPMGGTGWLVNTYALDANTLPAIALTPTL